METERYEVLAQYASDVVLIVDAEGLVEYVSPSAERLMGYRADEWLGRNAFDALHPDDFELAADAFGRALTIPGFNEPLEVRILQIPTGWRWFEVIATNLLDHPAIRGIVFTGRDITERVQAYEEIRRHDDRLNALLRHSNDVVVVVAGDGTLTYVSPSAPLLLGYPYNAHLGTKAIDLVHPEDRERVRATLLQALTERDHRATVELRMAHADGTWRDIEMVATNGLGDASVDGVVLNLRDVTDLRAAQKDIVANGRRFEAMLANLSDMVSVIDADGQMSYVSPAAEQLHGRRAADRVGGSIFDYVHPEDASYAAHQLQRVLAGPGLIPPFESRILHEDGTYRTFEVKANNLLHDPAVNGIIVNSRDITDRINAEAAVRRAEIERHRQQAELDRHRLEAELDQARRLESLGRLAAGVAHDFNNLIGVILNYASVAANHLDAGDPIAHDVARIQRAAEQAADVTRKLLVFGRADPVHPEVFDLNELIDDVTALVDGAFGAAITIERRLDAAGCPIRADRGQFEQLLMNLLVNARDALPRGGRIVITTATEAARDAVGERFVVLTVADDGVGMPTDVAERVFEPFFTTKSSERGSGLGLATVHAIVNRADGHVGVESEVGAGTTFRIRLAHAAAAAALTSSLG